MLENILKLNGAKKLNTTRQQTINGGGRLGPVQCQVGCAGLSAGDACYGSPDCECPGMCGSQSQCIMY